MTPEEPADYPAAWAWFTAEYPVLLAAVQLAADTSHHTHAWQLPHTLVPFFERQGHWHDFAATHHIALTATRDHADQQGQAHAHLGIGHARARFGRLDEARPHLQHALRLFEELGDRWGEAAALDSIGYAHHRLGRHQQAASYFDQVLAIDRELGDLYCQATDYDRLGDVHHAAGNTAQARHAWQQALNILDQLSDVPRLGPGYADPDAIRAKFRHHN